MESSLAEPWAPCANRRDSFSLAEANKIRSYTRIFYPDHFLTWSIYYGLGGTLTVDIFWLELEILG